MGSGEWSFFSEWVLIGKIIKNLLNSDLILDFFFLVRRWFRTLPCYFLFLLLNILWFYYLNTALPENYITIRFSPKTWLGSIQIFFLRLEPFGRRMVLSVISPSNSSADKVQIKTSIRLFGQWGLFVDIFNDAQVYLCFY